MNTERIIARSSSAIWGRAVRPTISVPRVRDAQTDVPRAEIAANGLKSWQGCKERGERRGERD